MAFRRISRTAVLALVLLAAGCYPDLDWREVTSAEGGYAILLPARPDQAQREVVIGGVALSMSMASVQREGVAFGVAHAEIPPGYTRRTELLAAARAGLLRNIDGHVVAEHGVAIDGVEGEEFRAEGMANGHPMQLAARVFIAGPRFYQVVFVGQSGRVPPAEVDLFLGSFRLLQK
jgi:hypothetical protein